MDAEPVGDITGAALLAAAEGAAEWLGTSLSELVENGVDWLLDFIGVTSCSDENKRKYRRAVADATLPELERWLRTRRVQSDRLNVNATGNCLKFALAEAARRAKREADGLQQAQGQAERVRRQFDRDWPSRQACFDAMRDARAADGESGFVWPLELRQEISGRCRRETTAQEGRADNDCPPVPIELQLVGVSMESWRAADSTDFAPLLQAVREAELTDDERRKLLALPYNERGAAFREIVEGREGGADWILWVIGILAALGLTGLAVKFIGGEK